MYMLGEFLRMLRADELIVLGRANIYQGLDYRGSIAWMKRCVVNRVSVDFPDVEVLSNFRNFSSFYSICCAPDFVGRVVMICQRLPERPLDESYNSSWGFRCSAMVLTSLPEPSNIAGDIARNASIIERRGLPNQTAVVPFSRCTRKAS